MQTQWARIILFIAAALLAAGATRAQDILIGKGIAQLWCSDCHLVDPPGAEERSQQRAHVFIYPTDEIDDRSVACGLPEHPSWAPGHARSGS